LEEVDSIIWEVGKNPAGRGPRIVRAKKNGRKSLAAPERERDLGILWKYCQKSGAYVSMADKYSLC